MIKKLIYGTAHLIFLFLGLGIYLVTGKNTTRGHRALVNLFCLTGGRFNEWVNRIVGAFQRSLDLQSKSGVLGDVSGPAGDAALGQLKDKGYVVFKSALPADACRRLMDFALSTDAVVRPMDGERKDGATRYAKYNPESPAAVRYDYDANALLAHPDVQALMADESLLALAEAYLRARPRFDVLSMWWHTNFHTQPDSEAAQFYHFDMDRFAWLKVFIYLTDVGPEDGPHSFIEGSHRCDGIPQKFLDRGYVRLTDEEVVGAYGPEKEIRFAAPKGTIIVEDTRGLHKGTAVTGNSRLILQLQLSNSLFGTAYPKSKFPERRNVELDEMIARNRDVYKAYL